MVPHSDTCVCVRVFKTVNWCPTTPMCTSDKHLCPSPFSLNVIFCNEVGNDHSSGRRAFSSQWNRPLWQTGLTVPVVVTWWFKCYTTSSILENWCTFAEHFFPSMYLNLFLNAHHSLYFWTYCRVVAIVFGVHPSYLVSPIIRVFRSASRSFSPCLLRYRNWVTTSSSDLCFNKSKLEPKVEKHSNPWRRDIQ